MMKLSVFFLLVFLQVSAHTTGQINLSVSNQPIDVVFQLLRKQTDYKIFAKNQDLEGTRKVTFQLTNASIEQVMQKTLDGQPLSYTIKDKSIFISRIATSSSPQLKSTDERLTPIADPIDVVVTVTNEEGEPVAGVTIQVKGGKISGATDAEGVARIKVDANAVLILTAVNIQLTEKSVNGSKDLSIRVKGKTGKLDEVQVIAYGTTTQRFNTGNVTTVKAAEIEKQPINNPLLALQGRVPGLNIVQRSGLPGEGLNIQLRGQNSIRFNGNEPLYLVDGVPFSSTFNGRSNVGQDGLAGGPISNLSPFFYINPQDIESIDILKDADATAIYGSRGANGVILITTKKGKIGKPTIDINLQHGWSQIPKKIDLLNTQQYLEMRNEAIKNDGINIATQSALIKAIRYSDVLYWDQQRYTDWQEELIGNTATSRQAQLSYYGGTSTVQYRMGLTYSSANTVFSGNFKNERVGANISVTGRSSNQKLSVTLSANYNSDENNLPATDLTSGVRLAPNAPAPYDEQGNINWHFVNGLSTFRINPFSALKKTSNIRAQNLVSSAVLSYNFLPGFDLKVSLGYNRLNTNSYTASPFAAISPDLWATSVRRANWGNSMAVSWIIEPQLTYSKKIWIGQLNALLGATLQKSKSETENLIASGYNTDDGMRSVAAATTLSARNTSSDYEYRASFARIGYNIQNKYLLNINIRRDGSSRFGPKQQYANFASIGAGWIFSEENWMKAISSVLDFGKIRLSYGTTGNDQINDYQYLDYYYYQNQPNPYLGVAGLSQRGIHNPYYAWETTRKLELGLELGFLSDSRILLNASYYRNRSSNQLETAILPDYVGQGTFLFNSPATVGNEGIEIGIQSTNIKSRNFSWTSAFNTSFNKNKLTRVYNPFNTPDLRIGNPLGYATFYKLLGVEPATGLYLFEDADGHATTTPTDKDRTELFNLNFPRFFGGLNNTIIYKEFQLDFLFQFVKQTGNIAVYDQPAGSNTGTFANQPVAVLERWQKQGDLTSIQRYSTGTISATNNNFRGMLQSANAYGDASFIRLKNVSLSWNLPLSVKEKLGLQQASLFVHGQNILTFTKYKGYDPENRSITSLPPLRTINAGIRVSM